MSGRLKLFDLAERYDADRRAGVVGSKEDDGGRPNPDPRLDPVHFRGVGLAALEATRVVSAPSTMMMIIGTGLNRI